MRSVYRLSARKLPSLTAPGRYPDGNCLYLQVAKPRRRGERNGGRSWIVRYHAPDTGKVREMGLGPLLNVSLEAAREKTAAAHSLIKSGVDPLEDRNSKRAVFSKTRTFGDYAEHYCKTVLTGLKNPKHRAQWESTLKTYCKPMWKKLLHTITMDDVFACIDPVWDEKTVTAKRLRGRIENVLSAAKVDGYRDGLNPARWQDNLAPKFKNRKQKAKKHHAAVPFEEMPAFMVELQKLKSTSARALEFVILTAVRTGEARKATWNEIDFEEKTWTIPAGHMKKTKQTDEPEDHCVPLCSRALVILQSLKPGEPDEPIFKVTRDARTRGKQLSDQALLEVVRGIREGFTTHGMRSSFRDWVGEVTNYPSDLGELALAHKIKNATEAAYRRRKGLDKRRPMMADWASYLAH